MPVSRPDFCHYNSVPDTVGFGIIMRSCGIPNSLDRHRLIRASPLPVVVGQLRRNKLPIFALLGGLSDSYGRRPFDGVAVLLRREYLAWVLLPLFGCCLLVVF